MFSALLSYQLLTAQAHMQYAYAFRRGAQSCTCIDTCYVPLRARSARTHRRRQAHAELSIAG